MRIHYADPQFWLTHGIKADSLDYRGYKVDLFEDTLGQQLVAVWDNRVFEFGVHNTQAREDLKLLIDSSLDTISRFENEPKWFGVKLEYFQNAGFRDIRLSYRGRILKVYPAEVSLDLILEDAAMLIPQEIDRRNNETNI